MTEKATLARNRYDPLDLLAQLDDQRPAMDGSEWCFRFMCHKREFGTDDFFAYLPQDERQHANARSTLVSFIAEIRTIDNAFQVSCEEDLRRHGTRLQDYKLHIGWISVAENAVTVRYWGTVVNTEYEMQFRQNDAGTWSEVGR
jgi:hypothetical protein